MTQRHYFWRAHYRLHALLRAFLWTQQVSGNPFTAAEIQAMSVRWPTLRAWCTTKESDHA